MALLALLTNRKTVLESGESRVNVRGKDRVQVLVNVYGMALCHPTQVQAALQIRSITQLLRKMVIYVSKEQVPGCAVSSLWQRGKA